MRDGMPAPRQRKESHQGGYSECRKACSALLEAMRIEGLPVSHEPDVHELFRYGVTICEGADGTRIEIQMHRRGPAGTPHITHRHVEGDPGVFISIMEKNVDLTEGFESAPQGATSAQPMAVAS